ncbi:MAG: hypothetical protein NDJ89_08115 [Oligoflexia bacterium]|nr:hypothetical protein [Oligoflexia bacterium]
MPVLLVAGIAYFLLAGLIILIWGRRLSRHGDWLAWSGVLVALGVFAALAGALAEEGYRAWHLGRGWVGSPGETGAIAVGVLEDPVGLAVALIALALTAVAFSSRQLILKEPRPERIYAALSFSTAGVALSWISLTPWLAFIGIGLTVLGGFFALGARWEENGEAALATRFVIQRSGGLILAVFGACGLALSRAGLSWGDPASWSTDAGLVPVDLIGGICLLAGLFVQLQPFPFLGWALTPSGVPTLLRALSTQIFPGLATFAVLIRSGAELERMGLLVPFGWVQLLSVAFAVGAGLFQSQWRMGFGAWLSSAFSITSACLVFSGPANAFSLLVGVALGGTAVAGCASSLGFGGSQSASNRSRALWARILGFAGMATATGLLLFAPAGGFIQWISGAWNDPLVAALFALAIFAHLCLGWKLAWQLSFVKNLVQVPWVSVLSPVLLVLFGLAVAWRGSLTGGAIPGDPDRVAPSAIELFFNGQSATGILEESAFLGASGTFWTSLVVALALGYWLARKARQRKEPQELKGVALFVAEGYRVDRGAERGLKLIARLGGQVVEAIDERVWREWLPRGADFAIRRIAALAMAIDTRLLSGLRLALRKCVDAPAAGLQLIQNGNIQWYIFFAIGSGVLMLLHFMRS